jgi:hypothetical protein
VILNALGLVAFVVFCMVLGYSIIKLKHAWYASAWRPLAPIISGTVRPNGGDTTWLIGTWKGKPIHARMTPRARDSDSDTYQSFFAVGVVELDGATNWDCEPATGLTSTDPEIRRRLHDAGIAERVQAVGSCMVAYDHQARTLFIGQDMHPRWCPRREEFVVLLDLATDLAIINARVNRREKAVRI